MFMPTFATSIVLLLATSVASVPLAKRQTNQGEATFFAPGLGACGITNSPADFMVAVSAQLFASLLHPSDDAQSMGNPNKNPVCGKQITANANGKSVTVTVEDRCPGCAQFDLDFSPAAFNVLADPSVGRLQGVTWSFT
ncbi:plant expansin [Hysterangium stoloniferum]|nr:plant expansin [Hysterangium stoloniferum]